MEDVHFVGAQEKVLGDIQRVLQGGRVCLVAGPPTCSGKTEIYIHLRYKETLRQGKQVLYLLPEIALTVARSLKTIAAGLRRSSQCLSFRNGG